MRTLARTVSPGRRNVPAARAQGGHWRDRMRRAALCIASVAMLSLAFAPIGQFHLAWLALAPALCAVWGLRRREALVWGFGAGMLFFATNLWWLWGVTIPGVLMIVLYFAMYWSGIFAGVAGASRIAGAGARPVALIAFLLLVPALWVSVEWLRTVAVPWAIPALFFPWLQVGYPMAGAPVLCQIADVTGVSGITFMVVMLNTLLALATIHRFRWRALLAPALVTGTALTMVLAYGLFRMGQNATVAGPRVMLLQSNFPHARGGERLTPPDVTARWHLRTTEEVLQGKQVNLIVWSECAVPPLNSEAMDHLRSSPVGATLREIRDGIAELTRRHGSALVTGGYYAGNWSVTGNARQAGDLRNSAYFFVADGQVTRYDKVHLVPFSEYMPFRESAPRLFRLLVRLGARDAENPLVAGLGLSIMHLGRTSDPAPDRGWHFVTPICLENLHPGYVRRTFPSDGAELKRVDFIVNISNDGWFARTEHAQHLQAVIFRSIENRAPAVRASNTGGSAFIDSCGRIDQKTRIESFAGGTAVATLRIDRRLTFYSRFGDLFAIGCCSFVLLGIPLTGVLLRSA